MVDFKKALREERGYPIFIQLKHRWHNAGILAYDPSTGKYWGILIIVRLRTNWSDRVLLPFLVALLGIECEKQGLLSTKYVCQYQAKNPEDEETVTEGARKNFEIYCNTIWTMVIMLKPRIDSTLGKPIEE